MICILAITFSSMAYAQQSATPASTNAATMGTAPQGSDQSGAILREVVQLIQDGNLDTALTKINSAIKLYPKVGGFYALRGSVYSRKNQLPQAEEDFKTALQLDPDNVVVKFNLIEVKLMQKQFDTARPGFVELEKDPDVGDLASYKVFLCDLWGGHADIAKKELDAFNAVGSKPSYYFANAAWALFHKDIEGGRGWLVSASTIYSPQKNEYYASSLRNFGYLPLPSPAPSLK